MNERCEKQCANEPWNVHGTVQLQVSFWEFEVSPTGEKDFYCAELENNMLLTWFKDGTYI